MWSEVKRIGFNSLCRLELKFNFGLRKQPASRLFWSLTKIIIIIPAKERALFSRAGHSSPIDSKRRQSAVRLLGQAGALVTRFRGARVAAKSDQISGVKTKLNPSSNIPRAKLFSLPTSHFQLIDRWLLFKFKLLRWEGANWSIALA